MSRYLEKLLTEVCENWHIVEAIQPITNICPNMLCLNSLSNIRSRFNKNSYFLPLQKTSSPKQSEELVDASVSFDGKLD